MSFETIPRLIGALPVVNPSQGICGIVEGELNSPAWADRLVTFLDEKIPSTGRGPVEVFRVEGDTAVCRCRSKVRDHEDPRYFEVVAEFKVDLLSGVLSALRG